MRNTEITAYSGQVIFVFYTTDTWKLSKGLLIGSLPYILAAIAVSI